MDSWRLCNKINAKTKGHLNLGWCSLESPITQWWSLRTRNRKVRVALGLFPEFSRNKNRRKSSLKDKGCHPKGWGWGVPFLFSEFSLWGSRDFFKCVTCSPRTCAACGCYVSKSSWYVVFRNSTLAHLSGRELSVPYQQWLSNSFLPFPKVVTFKLCRLQMILYFLNCLCSNERSKIVW